MDIIKGVIGTLGVAAAATGAVEITLPVAIVAAAYITLDRLADTGRSLRLSPLLAMGAPEDADPLGAETRSNVATPDCQVEEAN